VYGDISTYTWAGCLPCNNGCAGTDNPDKDEAEIREIDAMKGYMKILVQNSPYSKHLHLMKVIIQFYWNTV
jgi:hypothetical protein